MVKYVPFYGQSTEQRKRFFTLPAIDSVELDALLSGLPSRTTAMNFLVHHYQERLPRLISSPPYPYPHTIHEFLSRVRVLHV